MTKEKETPAAPKPRRWLRRLFVWLLVFSAIGLVINGPISRWAALRVFDKQLQAQGMHGKAHIVGSLMSGFTLSEISYTGSQGIQSLQIDSLAVDYRFLELFDSKLREITINRATVVVDQARFPDSRNQGSGSNLQLTETLQQIQTWVSQPAIDVRELDFTWLYQGELQTRINIDQFRHQADSVGYNFSGFRAGDLTGQSTPTQNVELVWKKDTLTLDRLEVLTDIAIEGVVLNWKNDFKAEGLLHFLKARLNIRIDDSIKLQLTDGDIDSQELVKRFKLDLPGTFVLSSLDAQILGWHQQPVDWQIKGSLHLDSARYEDYQLTNTTLQLKQNDQSYSLKLGGSLDSNPIEISTDGKWTKPTKKRWWAFTTASYSISTSKLGSLGNRWQHRPQGLDLSKTSAQINGNVQIENEELIHLDSKGTIQGIAADGVTLPPMSIRADYQSDGSVTASVQSHTDNIRAFDLEASYNQTGEKYQAKLSISETDPTWINALATVLNHDARVRGPLKLRWDGSGSTSDWTDIKQAHQGTLKIEKLGIKLPTRPAFQLDSQLSYDWPNDFKLQSLNLRENNWHASAEMHWDGKRIEATSSRLVDGEKLVASLSGSLPYQISIHDTDAFFEQNKPWNLSVKSQPIAFTKIRQWLDVDLINQLTGSTMLDIELNGTPKHPEIKGEAKATGVKGLNDQQLLPLDVAFDFYSKEQKLIFEGKIIEGKDQRLTAKGSVPFTPSVWLKDPDSLRQFFSSAPVSAELNFDRLPLARFLKVIPSLNKITGSVTGSASVSGTLEKPVYILNLNADAPLIKLTSSDVGDIRNAMLSIQLDQTQKATTKLTAEINGGKFEIIGKIDLNDISNPLFDITLNSRYALVHRDDLVSVRANADLRVQGSIDDATVSGNIGIVESLFYKDLELIPMAVPSSAVATVKLPALSQAKAQADLPVPEPFSKWKLDITVRTNDPILVRGNVATGNLTGSLKIGGTLSKPTPVGTIVANQIKAKLPFSILNIERGLIIFNGRTGLNPFLKITGKSTVGTYDVNVFVYGPASSPKTTLSSFPPLPGSEVMTLLATGTTTSNLENRSVATFKAFQIFLLKLQQENDKQGGNKLFKNLLTGVEDLNLNVGEVDPFTGRKFTSGTVEIRPRWHLTAQVDDTQNTRGLIIYVLRFR